MNRAATASISSVEEIPESRRQLVRDLILGLADSKRILGIRYADWVLGAPELEATIAASSIAQDEWGHSRILYALLKDFGDDLGVIEHGRDAAQYYSIEALDEVLATWPDFVVANALIDTALTIQLEALADSAYAPLRQRVKKQLEEERFHFGHGVAWLVKLAAASAEAFASQQAAIDAHWPAIVHWFGPDDFATELQQVGIVDATGGALRARFIERVTPAIERSGLAAPKPALDFSSWNPQSRRRSDIGPDTDAVARARGDRNRIFLMD